MTEILTKKLRDHLYRFEEAGGPNQVHAYLVCGTQKAWMIDGLWLAEGLLAEADKILKTEYKEKYTQENRDKWLSMLITHGHEDHAGKGMEEFLNAGCKVCMSQKDWPLLSKKYGDSREHITFLEEKMCGSFSDTGRILSEQKNGHIELGGITAQIIKMSGHTPGSLLVWVPEWNCLFTSDAIGAGVLWMQLPECSSLSQYGLEVEKLLIFLEKEKEETGKEVQIYPGHAQQILSEMGEQKNTLSYAYVREVLELTGKIQKNPQIGQKKQIDYPGLEKICVRSVGKKLLYDYCYDEACIG